MRFSSWVAALVAIGLFGMIGCGKSASDSKPPTAEEQKKINDEMEKLTAKRKK